MKTGTIMRILFATTMHIEGITSLILGIDSFFTLNGLISYGLGVSMFIVILSTSIIIATFFLSSKKSGRKEMYDFFMTSLSHYDLHSYYYDKIVRGVLPEKLKHQQSVDVSELPKEHNPMFLYTITSDQQLESLFARISFLAQNHPNLNSNLTEGVCRKVKKDILEHRKRYKKAFDK